MNKITIFKKSIQSKTEEGSKLTCEEKNKKLKKIVIGIVLLLPLPLDVFILAQGWFPNDTIYMICSVISSLCFFVGFFIVATTLMFKGKGESTYFVAGKMISNETVKKLDNFTLTEKIKEFNIVELLLRIFAVPAFVGTGFFVMEDPLNVYDNFENIVRAQIFTIFCILFIVAIIYLKLKKQKFKKSFIIMFIMFFLVSYYITIPEDNNKKILSSGEFVDKLSAYDYSVSKVYNIKSIDVDNSEIYLAERDDIKIYYIIAKKLKNSREIFELFFDEEKFNDCIFGGGGSISGNYKVMECENPDYFKIASKIKNTIIYVETNSEYESYLENLLIELGYGS